MQMVLSERTPPMIPGVNGGVSNLSVIGQPFDDPRTKFDGSFISFELIKFILD